jgi:thioredoxin-related protein
MHSVLKFLIIGCLSALFLFSAIGKLMAMDQFESMLTFYGFGVTSSAVAGRLILSLEFFMAAVVWLPRYRKQMLQGMLYLTLAFTLGLIWFKFSFPDATDCGCHGELLKLNPMIAIFKNIGIIFLAFAGVRLISTPLIKRKWNLWVMIVLVLISLAVPPIVSPPDFAMVEFAAIEEPVGFEGIEKVKSRAFSDNTKPGIDEDEKYILLFATPGCKFCKLMTTRIFGLKKSGQIKLPVYYVFPTDDEQVLEEFWGNSQSLPFPHISFNDFEEFLSLSGPRLPSLFLMKGEMKYMQYSYRTFSLKQIQEFETEAY